MTITISLAGSLSDREVLVQVQEAARHERYATAQLIALLMEVDTRRLYLGEGCSSLFTYCTHVLHLSEHAAYGRIEAARAARRFPVILERLADGTVSLTAIGLLAAHLTPANHLEVLDAACHKSKREVEHLVARLHPQPDVQAVVRKLPARTAQRELREPPAANVSDSEASSLSLLSVPLPVKRPAEVKPLAPERYKVQFTVSRETYEQFRRAQDLLRHVIPTGDPAAIFERALALLVADLSRSKLAAAARPRSPRTAPRRSRHIPAAVKRAVWQRDCGQCAFRGAHGRCVETGFLEFHHIVPFASGGETTSENLELRCRAHNAHESEQHFKPWQPQVREAREVYRAESATRSGPS